MKNMKNLQPFRREAEPGHYVAPGDDWDVSKFRTLGRMHDPATPENISSLAEMVTRDDHLYGTPWFPKLCRVEPIQQFKPGGTPWPWLLDSKEYCSPEEVFTHLLALKSEYLVRARDIFIYGRAIKPNTFDPERLGFTRNTSPKDFHHTGIYWQLGIILQSDLDYIENSILGNSQRG